MKVTLLNDVPLLYLFRLLIRIEYLFKSWILFLLKYWIRDSYYRQTEFHDIQTINGGKNRSFEREHSLLVISCELTQWTIGCEAIVLAIVLVIV